MLLLLLLSLFLLINCIFVVVVGNHLDENSKVSLRYSDVIITK